MLLCCCVAPLAVPHKSTADDEYEGYFIPKGEIFIPNTWSFAHDPSVYRDPSEFRPERFVGPSPEPDPNTIVFGHGRRICPGRLLAESSIFLNIALVLSAVNNSKLVRNGNVVEPHVDFILGVMSHPVPFQCDIIPRSKKAAMLVRAVEEEYPYGESDEKVLKNVQYEV